MQQMDRTAAILAAPSHAPPIHLTARHSARSSWRINASRRRASSHRESSVSSVQSFLSAKASMHGDGINEIASKAQSSEWLTFLDSLALIPEPLDEQNWSGKGQHVEYQRSEESNVPLVEGGILGHSASAIVQSVRCKRIRLARKTISCTRRFKREDAIKEVEQLQRLGHCHIVRVVGSYVIESKLSILLYPATEWSLDTFIDSIYQGIEVSSRKKHLLPSMRCLSETINFIHSRLVKHMDIKPKNLLVKALKSTGTTFNRFKIYVADFGIARSYKSSADAETEGRTSFTKLYAAPEVVDQGPRGFGADIFSLGCVFLEIFAAFMDFHGEQHKKSGPSSKHSDKLRSIREANEDFDESYQANTSALQDWVNNLDIVDNTSKLDQFLCSLVSRMIDTNPSKRPSISNIVGSSSLPAGCSSCHVGPELFEAAD